MSIGYKKGNCLALSTNSKSKSSFFFFAKQSFAKIDNANIAQMKFMMNFVRFLLFFPKKMSSPSKNENFRVCVFFLLLYRRCRFTLLNPPRKCTPQQQKKFLRMLFCFFRSTKINSHTKLPVIFAKMLKLIKAFFYFQVITDFRLNQIDWN